MAGVYERTVSLMSERYFEAAYLALRRCYEILLHDTLSAEEDIFRHNLIGLCRDVITDYYAAFPDDLEEEDDYIFDAANDEEFALWGDTR